MEIEVKYHLTDEEQIDQILADSRIQQATDLHSEEKICMKAAYFDTADRRLNREGITFRIRREDERVVATVKWNGSSEEGMHQREEINVPVDEYRLRAPDPDIFRESPMAARMKELIGERKLELMMEADFVRRQVRLDTGDAISELSFDIGEIRVKGRTGRLSEMEIELYSGDKGVVEELGAYLSEKYGLPWENRSKFRQGLDIGK